MPAFRFLTLISILLCFCVVVFGAYVRLADAGLGCPDWPGCYGHLDVPGTEAEIAHAQARYPERPVEAPKAWKEMIHRYLASTLGLLIVALALMSLRFKQARLPRRLPWLLVGLVIFQGILGMWTVTWQLKPLVVTGHLLGGMSTLSLLVLLGLRVFRRQPAGTAAPERRPVALAPAGLRRWAAAGLVVVALQIFLGGWTSTNYAALACPDFPTCHGQWVPDTDFETAFTLWHGLGINYEFGILDNDARMTIHWMHRVGALVVAAVIGLLGLLLLLRARAPLYRGLGGLVLGLLAVQATIGIMIVKLQLPLLLAAAHNAGAALLLLSLVSLNYYAWKPLQP